MEKRRLHFWLIICLLLVQISFSARATETIRVAAGVTFPADHQMTRQEFCVALAEMFIDMESADVAEPPPFSDLSDIDADSLPYISALYNLGVLRGTLSGGQLSMMPDTLITRQDAVVLLGRLTAGFSTYSLPFSDAIQIAPYAYEYVAWFAERGVITGYTDGTFKPYKSITAGEFTFLSSRAAAFISCNDATVETLTGTGSRGYLDGDPKTARFTLPYGICAAADGGLLIFDTYNNMIRTVSPDTVETLAGSIKAYDDRRFQMGYYVDGPLDTSLLNRPTGGVTDSKGRIFIADSENHVIRMIDGSKIYTFCGSTAGYSDGSVGKAMFNTPSAIAIDGNDNLYVADTLNHCVRKISPKGEVTTVAGTPQMEGYADGEYGNAMFRALSGIAVSTDGKTIYIADTGNHCIRVIENGAVTTVAGGAEGVDEDGDPLGGYRDGTTDSALFSLPVGLALADGVLIVADSGNNRIRALSGGIVTTVAGCGEPGDTDGGAMDASLHQPMGVFVRSGLLYIADTGNSKIKTMPFDASLYGGRH